MKKKRNEQNQPQTHDLPTPASPAAGKAAAMSLEDLESELLAGYGEEEDEADVAHLSLLCLGRLQV